MAIALKFSERVTGGGYISDDATGNRQNATFGVGPLPSSGLTLNNGILNFQANNLYLAQRTVTATTADNLDLAGGLSNFGGTLTFTFIKRLYIAIVSPDGTKSLRIGPQNVSNAWQGPWGGTGATDYVTTVYREDKIHPYTGWAVTAGSADILGIYNPGATSVTYAILIMGITS